MLNVLNENAHLISNGELDFIGTTIHTIKKQLEETSITKRDYGALVTGNECK